MTKEKMYSLAYAACLDYAASQGIKDDATAWVDRIIASTPTFAPCFELAATLRDDMTRASGRGSAFSAAKRIIRNAERYGNASTAGAWETPEGQCVCDMYHGVCVKDPIPGLPSLPYDATPFNLGGFLDSAENARSRDITDQIPAQSTIKAAIAQSKAAHPQEYKQGKPGMPLEIPGTDIHVNPQYLLDLLDMLPGARVYAGSSPLATIYMEAPAGRAVLCPVRRRDDAPCIRISPKNGGAV